MKLALNQAKRIAIAAAVALASVGLTAPSPARADVYYYTGEDGVFRFTREQIAGAKPFRREVFEGRASARRGAAKRSPVKPVAIESPAESAVARTAVAIAPARLGRSRSHVAYDRIILDYAARYDVDAALVKAIIHAESSFRPKARSHKGARGLMQLMPSTAGMYGVAKADLYEPRSNIRAGVRHLKRLLATFAGNVRLAVAAYNAGEGAVKRHGGLPPFRETRTYVRKVLRYYAQYADAVTVALRRADDEEEAA